MATEVIKNIQAALEVANKNLAEQIQVMQANQVQLAEEKEAALAEKQKNIYLTSRLSVIDSINTYLLENKSVDLLFFNTLLSELNLNVQDPIYLFMQNYNNLNINYNYITTILINYNLLEMKNNDVISNVLSKDKIIEIYYNNLIIITYPSNIKNIILKNSYDAIVNLQAFILESAHRLNLNNDAVSHTSINFFINNNGNKELLSNYVDNQIKKVKNIIIENDEELKEYEQQINTAENLKDLKNTSLTEIEKKYKFLTEIINDYSNLEWQGNQLVNTGDITTSNSNYKNIEVGNTEGNAEIMELVEENTADIDQNKVPNINKYNKFINKNSYIAFKPLFETKNNLAKTTTCRKYSAIRSQIG